MKIIVSKKSWIGLIPLLSALLITLAILIFLRFLPSKLPLFYSLPWGEKELVSKQQLLILPALMALISLFNLSIFWQLHPSQQIFKNILLLTSLLVSLILTITAVKIILIFI